MSIIAVGTPAVVDRPRESKQLCAVREGVFHGVVVELAARLLIAAASHPLCRDRPGALQPAGHIYIMAVPVDKESRRHPGETVGILKLEYKLVGALGQRRAVNRPVYAIDSHSVHVPDGPIVNPANHFLSLRRMPPPKAPAHPPASF